nr:hypothetical protein [Tanacetum cinerariifolium]
MVIIVKDVLFSERNFKEDLFTSCIENGILQDSSEPSNDNPNVVNALREPFVVNQDPGKNSSQSPPQINHHCCYGCGDPLEGISCHQCTCKLCGNGAHYGYNCPPKVPIIPNQEPFNNQTIKELPPIVPSFDPKSDLVHNSPNLFDPPLQLPFIPCEFCGNDARYGHYCTPQAPFVYPEPCYNQDLISRKNFMFFNNKIFVVKIAGLLMKLTSVNQGMKTIIMSKILAMIIILLVLINFNPNKLPSIILSSILKMTFSIPKISLRSN